MPVEHINPSKEPFQSTHHAHIFSRFQAAALRFQPTKRPQINSQKPKSKPVFTKVSSGPPASSSPDKLPVAPTQPVSKTTLADWAVADDGVNGFFASEKRQRGGRKKRKKTKDEPVVQDWDDLYDPTRPNNYEEYKQSEERIREIREWKDFLYAHRMARHRSSDM